MKSEFETLMRFCKKCYREFQTEEQAARHEARCSFKGMSPIGLIEGIEEELEHIAELDSLHNILRAEGLPPALDFEPRRMKPHRTRTRSSADAINSQS